MGFPFKKKRKMSSDATFINSDENDKKKKTMISHIITDIIFKSEYQNFKRKMKKDHHSSLSIVLA